MPIRNIEHQLTSPINWWSWLATGLPNHPQQMVDTMVATWIDNPDEVAILKTIGSKWQLRRNALETLGLATWAIAQNATNVELVPNEVLPLFALALGIKVWLQSRIVEQTNAAAMEQIAALRHAQSETEAVQLIEVMFPPA